MIIHGYFTGYGHVVVVTGYDSQGYYANDPAGQWNQSFMGSYDGPRDDNVGRSIYYQKHAFESAIGTSNGETPLPLWYHILR